MGRLLIHLEQGLCQHSLVILNDIAILALPAVEILSKLRYLCGKAHNRVGISQGAVG